MKPAGGSADTFQPRREWRDLRVPAKMKKKLDTRFPAVSAQDLAL